MVWLLVAGVLAQGADAITMRFEHEANPLIVALGPTAYLAKMLLILGIVALAWSLPRLQWSPGWLPRISSRSLPQWPRLLMATLLSCELLVTGLLGTASNLR